MLKSPFFGRNYGHIYFLDTLQGKIRFSSHRSICLDAKSPKLLNLVKEIFFGRPMIVINVKIPIFGRNYGHIYFLDTLQGRIRLCSLRPICLNAKSPQLLNLGKETLFLKTNNIDKCQNHQFLAKIIVIFIFQTHYRAK